MNGIYLYFVYKQLSRWPLLGLEQQLAFLHILLISKICVQQGKIMKNSSCNLEYLRNSLKMKLEWLQDVYHHQGLDTGTTIQKVKFLSTLKYNLEREMPHIMKQMP